MIIIGNHCEGVPDAVSRGSWEWSLPRPPQGFAGATLDGEFSLGCCLCGSAPHSGYSSTRGSYLEPRALPEAAAAQ